MSEAIKVEFKNIFKIEFLLIFSAIVLSTNIDQYLNKQIEEIIRSPNGLSNMIWIWGALSLVSSLLFPLVQSLMTAQILTGLHVSLSKIFSNYFEMAFIETLRAWGKTFLWCFAFILPGLIVYSYYLMSPFIVMFSKKYADGEVDALEHSKLISKKFWWQLNVWLTVFYLVIPLITSSLLDKYRLYNSHPISALLCSLLETFILFTFHFLVLKSFLKKLIEVENGVTV